MKFSSIQTRLINIIVINKCETFTHTPSLKLFINSFNTINSITIKSFNESRNNYVLVNIPFSTKALLILLMSAFFLQKISFFGQNDTFTQSTSVRAVLEIF